MAMFGFHARALADTAKYGPAGVCVLCGEPLRLSQVVTLDLGRFGSVDIHDACGQKCPDTDSVSSFGYKWKGQE